MGVPQWRVSHLSEIPYILNEDVAAGGDNSAAQRALSALLSGSAAAFAHTEDPTVSRGKTFKNWPPAYPDQSGQALSSEYPQRFTTYVVGGPLGGGSATIASNQGTSSVSVLENALDWEKLIQRCNFVNSILAEIGV